MNNFPLITVTLQSLIEEENTRTFDAQQRLGTIVPLAQRGLTIFSTAVERVDRDNGLIAAFMLAIQKSITLAFLSYIRSHTAQAEFNCRQAIEITALGAYLLANADAEIYDRADPSKAKFRSRQTLSGEAYKWLEQTEPELSEFLADFKKHINESTAHGSIYVTTLTTDLDTLTDDGDQFLGSFFDNIDADVSRAYLMSFCRLIVLIVETMRRANERAGGLVFKDSIQEELETYAKLVDAYREALGAVIGGKPQRDTARSPIP